MLEFDLTFLIFGRLRSRPLNNSEMSDLRSKVKRVKVVYNLVLYRLVLNLKMI